MRKVLILIKGLGRGGAELLLLSATPYLDRERFDYRFAYLLPWKDDLVADLTSAGLPGSMPGRRQGRRLGGAAGVAGPPRADRPGPRPLARGRGRGPGGRRPPGPYRLHRAQPLGSLPPGDLPANLASFPRNDHVFAVSDEVRASIRYPGPMRLLPMPPLETLHHGLDPAAVAGWAGGPGEDGSGPSSGSRRGPPWSGPSPTSRPPRTTPTCCGPRSRSERPCPTSAFCSSARGRSSPRSRRLADELGLDGTVIFAGFRTDAHRLAAEVDVFTLSSAYEGLPIALIEAMALGRPCVATSVGGVPEVVSDGAQGVLVPPRDPDALAGGLVRLLADPGSPGHHGRGRPRAGPRLRHPQSCPPHGTGLLEPARLSGGRSVRRSIWRPGRRARRRRGRRPGLPGRLGLATTAATRRPGPRGRAGHRRRRGPRPRGRRRGDRAAQLRPGGRHADGGRCCRRPARQLRPPPLERRPDPAAAGRLGGRDLGDRARCRVGRGGAGSLPAVRPARLAGAAGPDPRRWA